MIQTQILRSWMENLSALFHKLLEILSSLRLFLIRILNFSGYEN